LPTLSIDTLKRFSLVVLLTGAGHLISLIFYPVANGYVQDYDLVKIAEFESLSLILLSILGFGINATATRDVAISKDYKAIISSVQSARLTLAVILFIAAFIYGLVFQFTLPVYIVLMSPIFSLNYDFILYGVGKPTLASIVSFFRLSLPMLLCFFVMFFYQLDYSLFVIINVLFVFVSSYLVSNFLKTDIFFPLRFDFYTAYYSALLVGVAGVVISIYRFGYLSFFIGRLSDSDIITLAFFSKFCLVVVAARRIVLQFFYTKIATDTKSFRIDIILFAGALFLLFALFLFGDFLHSYVPSGDGSINIITACGLALFLILSTGTSDSKILLWRKDYHFFIIQVLPFVVGVCLIFVLGFSLYSVVISLLCIEALTALFNQCYVFYCVKMRLV